MAFKIYKPGQGKNTRLWSALILAVIVGLGCYRLYQKLQAFVENPWFLYLIPVVLFVIFGLLIFWLVNKPSLADFMIASEGEMKKVSWSSRQEIVVSTSIVIVVVVLMATLLGVTDLTFRTLFDGLFGLN